MARLSHSLLRIAGAAALSSSLETFFAEQVRIGDRFLASWCIVETDQRLADGVDGIQWLTEGSVLAGSDPLGRRSTW